MRFVSLFAGIGGFDLGLERAGHECVAQVEIDPACRSILAHHFPNARRYEDVATVHAESKCPDGGCERCLPADIDLICGGFPCQDLSVAGRRQGLAGERSGLFFEFMRLARECAPCWILIENVPGLLSSNDGRDMGIVVGTLGELGYRWAYRVLDAQYFGVAQRRRRVFIVGHSGNGTGGPEILFESESCDGNPPPQRTQGTSPADRTIASTLNSGGNAGGFRTEPGEHLVVAPDTAATLSAGSSPNSAIPGRHKEDDVNLVAAALTTRVGQLDDQDTSNLVSGPVIATSLASDVLTSYDHTQPLTGRNGDPGVIAVALRADASRDGVAKTPSPDAEGRVRLRDPGFTIDEDVTPTLDAGTPHTVAHSIAFAQNQRDEVRDLHDLAGALAAEPGMKQQTFIANPPRMLVRRLTPRECERLQGFPDDWTAGQSDSVRYRQLGNAVCVNVAEWIARRLPGGDAA